MQYTEIENVRPTLTLVWHDLERALPLIEQNSGSIRVDSSTGTTDVVPQGRGQWQVMPTGPQKPFGLRTDQILGYLRGLRDVSRVYYQPRIGSTITILWDRTRPSRIAPTYVPPAPTRSAAPPSRPAVPPYRPSVPVYVPPSRAKQAPFKGPTFPETPVTRRTSTTQPSRQCEVENLFINHQRVVFLPISQHLRNLDWNQRHIQQLLGPGNCQNSQPVDLRYPNLPMKL